MQLLGSIPPTLRNELLQVFNEITTNYRENRWEPAELNGGKFSEVVYSIIKGYVDGSFPARASKPNPFDQACRNLEQATGFPRSVRIGIPRILIGLYDIRNSRSVGHVGGDVDPNAMDAAVVVAMAKWVMAELIRIFHQTDTVTASQAVEALTERTLPYIWEVDGVKRVLITGMTLGRKTLHLLYASTRPVNEKDLVEWVEVSRLANFRRTLRQLHSDRLIEFNEKTGQITLSPKGVNEVEQTLA